jgi:hypothetical protein
MSKVEITIIAMDKKRADEELLAHWRKDSPHLTEEQLLERKAVLDNYLEICLQIFNRMEAERGNVEKPRDLT